MRNAEVVENPIKSEAMPTQINPAVVEKLRTDIIVLEKDAIDKQKLIDKLTADAVLLDDRIKDLEKLSS